MLLLIGGSTISLIQAQERPNIIIILADDMGYTLHDTMQMNVLDSPLIEIVDDFARDHFDDEVSVKCSLYIICIYAFLIVSFLILCS